MLVTTWLFLTKFVGVKKQFDLKSMKNCLKLQILVILVATVLAETPSSDSSFSMTGWLGEQFINSISAIASFVVKETDELTDFDCEFKCNNASKLAITVGHQKY